MAKAAYRAFAIRLCVGYSPRMNIVQSRSPPAKRQSGCRRVLSRSTCRGRGRRRGCRRLLQILVVPSDVTLVSVAYVARSLYAVELVWIDDQLRVNAEASERLIHLLASLNGDVEVAL